MIIASCSTTGGVGRPLIITLAPGARGSLNAETDKRDIEVVGEDVTGCEGDDPAAKFTNAPPVSALAGGDTGAGALGGFASAEANGFTGLNPASAGLAGALAAAGGGVNRSASDGAGDVVGFDSTGLG